MHSYQQMPQSKLLVIKKLLTDTAIGVINNFKNLQLHHSSVSSEDTSQEVR